MCLATLFLIMSCHFMHEDSLFLCTLRETFMSRCDDGFFSFWFGVGSTRFIVFSSVRESAPEHEHLLGVPQPSAIFFMFWSRPPFTTFFFSTLLSLQEEGPHRDTARISFCYPFCVPHFTYPCVTGANQNA